MKINNKELIQSYIITSARYDYSVYEKRVLYAIINVFQSILENKQLDQRYTVQKDLFGDFQIQIPIKSCLKDEKDKNHALVKKALKDLESKSFEYEDDNIWQLIRIIQSPEIHKNDEFIRFRLHWRMVEAFHDFSKGFSKYEFITAMQFDSTYAMRFYELFSGQKKPIRYGIENLKLMFKVQDKYERVNDFIKFVVQKAKEELDKKSPVSFTYKVEKAGRKYQNILFTPVQITKNKNPFLYQKEMQHQYNASLSLSLDRLVVNYLKENR